MWGIPRQCLRGTSSGARSAMVGHCTPGTTAVGTNFHTSAPVTVTDCEAWLVCEKAPPHENAKGQPTYAAKSLLSCFLTIFSKQSGSVKNSQQALLVLITASLCCGIFFLLSFCSCTTVFPVRVWWSQHHCCVYAGNHEKACLQATQLTSNSKQYITCLWPHLSTNNLHASAHPFNTVLDPHTLGDIFCHLAKVALLASSRAAFTR